MQFAKNALVYLFGVFALTFFVTVFSRVLSIRLFKWFDLLFEAAICSVFKLDTGILRY